MARNIIIIEAPKKAASFKKYVGPDYDIVPTYGHCVDLPPKKLSVDIRNGFVPTFEVMEDSKAVVKEIKARVKKAEKVFLMTDEDREGEAIAWHIYEQIKDCTNAVIVRATTNQITESSIKHALANPGQLDMQKVDAYKARRMLDRLCGYKTSFLTKQATGGTSAGRVQSAVLRVLVDRETEIKNFVPKEYWVLTAHLSSSKGAAYHGVLDEKIEVPNEKEATRIYDSVINGNPLITLVEPKEVSVNPYPPFTTLPLTGAASTILGWQAERTMRVAQSLYEGGHITYHRTDSPVMAPEAIDDIRHFVRTTYGSDYLPDSPRVYTAKKGAQEAHECCRPTNINNSPGLSDDESRLYDLIWRRAVSSQMKSGLDRRLKVVTRISNYDFISRGKISLFDGFRRVWNFSQTDDIELPPLKEGEKCTLRSLDRDQKFTQPPPRYSVASLGKLCEDEQITRPSTFSNAIVTLKNRKYIGLQGKSFQPTDLGMKVVEFLKEADVCFIDVKFTAEMEKQLDQIQEASSDVKTVMTHFWDRLKKDIENGKAIRLQKEVSEYDCPKCQAKLLLKHSLWGPFYTCSKNKKLTKKEEKEGKTPECSYIAKVGKDGSPVEKVVVQKEYAVFPCEKCQGRMVKRQSKHGEFYGCEKFPACRSTASLDGTFNKTKTKTTRYRKKKS